MQQENGSGNLSELLAVIEKQAETIATLRNGGVSEVRQPKSAGATENENQIDIFAVLQLFLHRWWLILLGALLCAGGTLLFQLLNYSPVYTATAKVFANPSSISLSSSKIMLTSGDLNSSKALIPTYSVILNTHLVLDEAGKELDNLGYSGLGYSSLRGKITCSSVNDTAIMAITVTDSDSNRAVAIANTMTSVLPDQISKVIEGSSVQIVDLAYDASTTSSGITQKCLIGALIGAAVVCALIYLFDYLLNDAITSEVWLNEAFKGIPVLGNVPDTETEGKSGGYYRSYYGTSYYGNATGKKQRKGQRKK